MDESPVEFEVPANLDTAFNGVVRRLDLLAGSVAAGLSSVATLTSTSFVLPSSYVQLRTDPKHTIGGEERQLEFSRWIVASGVRDAIEEVSTYLEHVSDHLAIHDLLREQGLEVPEELYEERVLGPRKALHSKGIEAKIKHLSAKWDLVIDDGIRDQVLSINGLRNCLVHRRGIVGEKDLGKHENLTITYFSTYYKFQEEGVLRPLTIPMTVPAGWTCCFVLCPTSRSFKLGETINLSSRDFCDLLFTVRNLCSVIYDQVSDAPAPYRFSATCKVIEGGSGEEGQFTPDA